MRQVTLSLPEMGLMAGTRALFGAGVALLLADRLARQPRRAIGWTLALVGAASTIPLLMDALSSAPPRPPRPAPPEPSHAPVAP